MLSRSEVMAIIRERGGTDDVAAFSKDEQKGLALEIGRETLRRLQIYERQTLRVLASNIVAALSGAQADRGVRALDALGQIFMFSDDPHLECQLRGNSRKAWGQIKDVDEAAREYLASKLNDEELRVRLGANLPQVRIQPIATQVQMWFKPPKKKR